MVQQLRPDENQYAAADGNERHKVMDDGGQSHCGFFLSLNSAGFPASPIAAPLFSAGRVHPLPSALQLVARLVAC
jgi:hypothetical protein